MLMRHTYWVGKLVVGGIALRDDSVGPPFRVTGTSVTSDLKAGFLAVDHDPALEPPFEAMSGDGQLPVFTVAEGLLVAYGWLCTPATSRPRHLPREASGKYWIHYCGTKLEWRGRGLYKQTLSALCRLAFEHSGASDTSIYIDVQPENRPAVAATSTVGFSPAGTAGAFHVPLVGYFGRTWMPPR